MTEWRKGVAPARPRAERLSWEDVAESLDLEAALDALGVDVRREARGERWAYCPLPDHPGRDASGTNFSIKEDGLVWKCFTCDEGGTLPELVMRLRGLVAWQEALHWLSEYSDVETGGGDEAYRKNMDRLERDMAGWEDRPSRERKTMPVFAPGVLEQWRLPPPGALDRWHISTREDLRPFDLRFDDRHERLGYVGAALIIPHFFGGKLVGYQERWLDDNRPKNVPKYTNTRDFPKAETLFNWDRAVEASRAGETVYVVESVMTVVRLYCLGVTAVSTFGASVSDEQQRLLATLRAGVALSLDNDGPGRKARQKLARRLAAEVPVKIVPLALGDKSDLADLGDEDAREVLSGAYSYTGIDPIRSER